MSARIAVADECHLLWITEEINESDICFRNSNLISLFALNRSCCKPTELYIYLVAAMYGFHLGI